MTTSLKLKINEIDKNRIKIFPKQSKNWCIFNRIEIQPNGKYKSIRYIRWNDIEFKILPDPVYIHGIFKANNEQWYGIK